MLTSLPAKAVPFVNIQDGLTLAQAVVDTVRDPLVVLDQNRQTGCESERKQGRAWYESYQGLGEAA